jgi:hypothetical protein
MKVDKSDNVFAASRSQPEKCFFAGVAVVELVAAVAVRSFLSLSAAAFSLGFCFHQNIHSSGKTDVVCRALAYSCYIVGVAILVKCMVVTGITLSTVAVSLVAAGLIAYGFYSEMRPRSEVMSAVSNMPKVLLLKNV